MAKKTFGNYKILDKIAEGGFGTTYLAEHIQLGTKVCIKHALNVSEDDRILMFQEAQAIWDLRHFSIPAMRDIIKMPDGSWALVMSYVPGPTMAQLLEYDEYKNGLPAEHVAWIAERCLNALKYLHYHGVVHGDVKPQNIIIQPDSHTVVLVDYGLSLTRPRPGDEAKGYTPYFVAPELESGKVPIPESDLFGLGMSMIFALGGDVAAVRVPNSTPDNLCDLIKRMIRRNPLKRPQVWEKEDLCDTIKEVRVRDFGRANSGMKPLKI